MTSAKVSQHFQAFVVEKEAGPPARRRGGARRRTPGARATCNFFAKFCKFLAGSFSAVSTRNFARKYAFDSIFQALQDLHPFAPLQSQNFRKKIGLKKQQFS